MRRRLDLAMTLVGDPRIIFLDEPTTGLDPRSRRVMWDIVRELVADGVTILLTTQYLEEADRLAHRIALLDGGRIVAQGTPAELKRLVPGGQRPARVRRPAALDRATRALAGASRDDDGLALQVAERRRRPLAARAARPARRRGDRGRRPVGPARRPRRRLPLPDRRGDGHTRSTQTTDDHLTLLTDSATMLRRSLRRMRRYPSLTFFIAGIPVVLLLLFVYVFGGTLGAGLARSPPLGGAVVGRDAYVAYVVPGILLITVAGAARGPRSRSRWT